jgi:hypothetical protein
MGTIFVFFFSAVVKDIRQTPKRAEANAQLDQYSLAERSPSQAPAGFGNKHRLGVQAHTRLERRSQDAQPAFAIFKLHRRRLERIRESSSSERTVPKPREHPSKDIIGHDRKRTLWSLVQPNLQHRYSHVLWRNLEPPWGDLSSNPC